MRRYDFITAVFLLSSCLTVAPMASEDEIIETLVDADFSGEGSNTGEIIEWPREENLLPGEEYVASSIKESPFYSMTQEIIQKFEEENVLETRLNQATAFDVDLYYFLEDYLTFEQTEHKGLMDYLDNLGKRAYEANTQEDFNRYSGMIRYIATTGGPYGFEEDRVATEEEEEIYKRAITAIENERKWHVEGYGFDRRRPKQNFDFYERYMKPELAITDSLLLEHLSNIWVMAETANYQINIRWGTMNDFTTITEPSVWKMAVNTKDIVDIRASFLHQQAEPENTTSQAYYRRMEQCLPKELLPFLTNRTREDIAVLLGDNFGEYIKLVRAKKLQEELEGLKDSQALTGFRKDTPQWKREEIEQVTEKPEKQVLPSDRSFLYFFEVDLKTGDYVQEEGQSAEQGYSVPKTEIRFGDSFFLFTKPSGEKVFFRMNSEEKVFSRLHVPEGQTTTITILSDSQLTETEEQLLKSFAQRYSKNSVRIISAPKVKNVIQEPRFVEQKKGAWRNMLKPKSPVVKLLPSLPSKSVDAGLLADLDLEALLAEAKEKGKKIENLSSYRSPPMVSSDQQFEADTKEALRRSLLDAPEWEGEELEDQDLQDALALSLVEEWSDF